MTRFWTVYERTCQWLLLLPFLVVQLIGPGAMPQIGPQGIELVLCSDNALRTVMLSSDGEVVEGDPLAEHFSPCDWAIANGQLAQTSPVMLPVRTAQPVEVGHTLISRHLMNSAVSGLRSARAPPQTI